MGLLDDVYSVDEVARFLGLKPSQVYALLRKDQHTPPMERSLPGAWKEHGIYNVEWFIPASAVEHYHELRGQRTNELIEDAEV